MSCALALAAAFVLTPAETAAAQTVPVAATAAPTALASEPLFTDIVTRAQALHGRVSAGDLGDPSAFRADVTRLAELDMQGHRTLAERGTDPDLKCMLRGMSEDLTRRLGEWSGAADEAGRRAALAGMAATLEENAGVILAPSRPPV